MRTGLKRQEIERERERTCLHLSEFEKDRGFKLLARHAYDYVGENFFASSLPSEGK